MGFALLLVSLFVAGTLAALTQQQLLAAGRCETWQNAPSACSGLLNSQTSAPLKVWTAPALGLNQTSLQSLIPMTMLLELPYGCAVMYLRLFCGTAFQSCTNEAALGDAVPHPPCKSVCQDVNTACAIPFALANFPGIDCNEVSTVSGGPLWPNPADYPLGCSAWPVQNMAPTVYSCPPGSQFLGATPDPFTGLPCSTTLAELQQTPINPLILLNTGRCEESWDGAPLACSGLLQNSGKNVWTAPLLGLNQTTYQVLMNSPVSPNATTTYMSPVLGMPYNCSTFYLRLICGTFFPSCTVLTNLANFSVPNPPCNQVCQDANDACGEFFASLGAPPLNCSQLSAQSGGPQWPLPGQYAFGCDPWPVEEMGRTVYECPDPMVFIAPDADANSGLPCAVDCLHQMAFLFPDVGYIRAGFITFMVLGWISWVCGFYLLITYLTFPDLRKFPERMTIPLLFGVVAMYSPLLGSSGVGINNDNRYLCDNDFKTGEHSGLSRWSAWSFLFGGWLIANYWLVQSFTLFAVVVLKSDPTKFYKKEIVFHTLALIWALGFSFAGLGNQAMGFTGIWPFAFFRLDSKPWENWVFWHGWVILYLVQEFFTSGTSLAVMLSSSDKIEGFKRSQMWSILGFAFIFFVTALASVSNQLYSDDHYDQLTGSVGEYYKCMYSGGTDEVCQALLYKWPPGLYWWGIITFGIIGVDAFVLFGLMKKNVRCRWCSAFAKASRGEDFFELV